MVIRIQNVTKHYTVGPEKIRALDGVDLEVDRNEYVAVMGTSGSGKSTLMNILGCLDRPTGGTYELDGRNVTRMGGGSLARVRNERIGFVFQSFELLPRFTALKNVELPLIYSRAGWWNRRSQAKRALETVGLGDRIRHKPNQLSGGQNQRLPFALLLLMYQSIFLALGQIRTNKVRSLLTTVGIVIGIASVTAVIAALTGLKAKVLSEFETFGTNKMFIYPYIPPSGRFRHI